MPVWSPDARSIAFTFVHERHLDLFRIFRSSPSVRETAPGVPRHQFRRRPGARRPLLALTLSCTATPRSTCHRRDGQAGAPHPTRRRSTRAGVVAHGPTDRVVSDRAGSRAPRDGRRRHNVRQPPRVGPPRQPRWSPKGNTSSTTANARARHDLWASTRAAPTRVPSRRPRRQPGASWRLTAAHRVPSNRTGRWQLYFMLLDGTALTQIPLGVNDRQVPTWSPRLRDSELGFSAGFPRVKFKGGVMVIPLGTSW